MGRKLVIQTRLQPSLKQHSDLKTLRKASFLQSAAEFSQCPEDIGWEVAFVGRSNAGKSSVLNRVTDNGRLARTSKTPGRTQLLNFFKVDDERRLVDLPGYGFAKVQAKQQKAWEQEMILYLNNRRSLAGLVLVMDIRHPMQRMDENFLNWAVEAQVPVRLLLNKADKLSNNQAKTTLFRAQASAYQLAPPELVQMQLFSATKSQGTEDLAACLAEWLGFADDVNSGQKEAR